MKKIPKTLQFDVQDVLSKAGFSTPLDALFVVPARAEDCPQPVPVASWKDFVGQRIYVEGEIVQSASQVQKKVPGLVRVVLRIDGASIDCEEFGFLGSSTFRRVAEGEIAGLFAEPRFFGRRLVLTSPQYVAPHYRGRAMPVYPRLKRCKGEAIGRLANALWMPEAIRCAEERVRRSFPLHDEASILALANTGATPANAFKTLPSIFEALHRPRNQDDLARGARAASMLSIGGAVESARSAARREPDPRSVIDIPSEIMVQLKDGLPFALNDEQVAAIRSLWASLRSVIPSEYLLMGEVGSGKSVTFGLLAAGAQAVGARVAIIIPNSVLAIQVVSELRRFFPSSRFEEVRADVKPTEASMRKNPVLVGTQAINSWAKKIGWEPDLLIFDEQQKSSTAQRGALMAPWTNRIEATATALPRSMGLCLYGQQSMAIISKPASPKNIRTMLAGPDKKRWLYEQLQSAISAGGKVAVILPAVVEEESAEDADLAERRRRKIRAVESASEMWEKNFPGRTVILHGQMSEEAKRAALERACGDGADVCVASSIIEIGINIPRLKVVVCLEADRFGVSTLHQMRGRLVREGGEGLFVMYCPGDLKPESIQRLQLLEKHTSGVELAERDMAMRGFGDLGSDSEFQSGTGMTLFRNVTIWPNEVRDALKWATRKERAVGHFGDHRRAA